MDSISTLANIIGGAVRTNQRAAKVVVGQVQGTGVSVGGATYQAPYTADTGDAYSGKPVYVLVSDDQAVVIGEP